jgi:UPF0716 protein FxsA
LARWLILGLLLAPVLELVVFAEVAHEIGLAGAVALTILISLAGMAVIRSAGTARVRRFRTVAARMTVRETAFDLGDLAVVLGGLLLVVPGFITDVIGVLVLLPAARRWLGRSLARLRPRSASQVDLDPHEWRRVPEQSLDRRPRDSTP